MCENAVLQFILCVFRGVVRGLVPPPLGELLPNLPDGLLQLANVVTALMAKINSNWVKKSGAFAGKVLLFFLLKNMLYLSSDVAANGPRELIGAISPENVAKQKLILFRMY